MTETTTISTDLVRAMYDLINAHEEQYELAEQLVHYWASDGYNAYYTESELVSRWGTDHGQVSLEEIQELDNRHEAVMSEIKRLTEIVRTNELLRIARPEKFA